MALTHLGIYKISKSQTIAEVYTDRTSNKRSTVPLSENARWVNLYSALSEKQLLRSGALEKTNVGFALFADIRFFREPNALPKASGKTKPR